MKHCLAIWQCYSILEQPVYSRISDMYQYINIRRMILWRRQPWTWTYLHFVYNMLHQQNDLYYKVVLQRQSIEKTLHVALLYTLKHVLMREVKSPARNGRAVLELLLEKSIFLLNINKMLKLTCYMICLKLSLSMQNNWTIAGELVIWTIWMFHMKRSQIKLAEVHLSITSQLTGPSKSFSSL